MQGNLSCLVSIMTVLKFLIPAIVLDVRSFRNLKNLIMFMYVAKLNTEDNLIQFIVCFHGQILGQALSIQGKMR